MNYYYQLCLDRLISSVAPLLSPQSLRINNYLKDTEIFYTIILNNILVETKNIQDLYLFVTSTYFKMIITIIVPLIVL